jgi:hypothetical protein
MRPLFDVGIEPFEYWLSVLPGPASEMNQTSYGGNRDAESIPGHTPSVSPNVRISKIEERTMRPSEAIRAAFKGISEKFSDRAESCCRKRRAGLRRRRKMGPSSESSLCGD